MIFSDRDDALQGGLAEAGGRQEFPILTVGHPYPTYVPAISSLLPHPTDAATAPSIPVLLVPSFVDAVTASWISALVLLSSVDPPPQGLTSAWQATTVYEEREVV